MKLNGLFVILLAMATAVAPAAAQTQIFNSTSTSITWAPYTVGVAAADFDLDGRVEVATVANMGLDGVFALNDDGSASRTLLGNWHGQHRDDIALADLEGDGDLDIFYSGEPSGWYVNNGTAGFSQGAGIPIYGKAIAAGDLNGDALADIVLAAWNVTTVFMNRGGSFVATQYLPGAEEMNAALGDIDGDGDLDLSLARAIYINDGTGKLADSGQNLYPESTYRSWERKFADLDSDGDLDLAIAEWDFGSYVMLNDGSGHFTWAGQRLAGSLSVAVGDVNADGHLDVVTTRPVNVYLGDGTGRFGSSVQTLPATGYHAALADINNDSRVDLIALDGSWRNPSVYVHYIPPCTFGPSTQPMIFTRDTGKPATQTMEWNSCGGPGTATIRATSITSAYIWLNGALIAGPADFHGPSTEIVTALQLREGRNSISVQLNSKPGGQLSIEFAATN